MAMGKLNDEVERISKHLSEKQSNFDKVMQISRDVIRDSGQVITLLHNDEEAAARRGLAQLSATVRSLAKIDAVFKYHTLQAYQEYAEAFIFFGIKTKGGIPAMSKVGVDKEAYLLGLMDVEGELKREILEALRAGKLREAERYFSVMKGIYDDTRRLRFAEAVLSGFRKKQDVARIQLENAGSEILMFKARRS